MKFSGFSNSGSGFARPVGVTLALILAVGQCLSVSVMGQGSRSQRNPRQTKRELAEARQVAHVLSRLTFGARPGDFERVKAMGVDAFIAQQLDPDSLDAGPVIARLKRLPTLGMATPVIIEQYTPPKPGAVPSPVPAKTPDNATAPAQKLIAQNPSNPLAQT